MKMIRTIKANDEKIILKYQREVLKCLKLYCKALDKLTDVTFNADEDERIGYDGEYDGSTRVLFDLAKKINWSEDNLLDILPKTAIYEAFLGCRRFIQEAESVLNKPESKDSQKTDDLQNDFNTFQQQLMEKLKEGEKKGIVDWLDGVYLRDGKVEIIYSTHRKFRHPDEYFDMRYDTPEELQQYNRWEYEFDNILRDFKKKHDIEIDIHA